MLRYRFDNTNKAKKRGKVTHTAQISFHQPGEPIKLPGQHLTAVRLKVTFSIKIMPTMYSLIFRKMSFFTQTLLVTMQFGQVLQTLK